MTKEIWKIKYFLFDGKSVHKFIEDIELPSGSYNKIKAWYQAQDFPMASPIYKVRKAGKKIYIEFLLIGGYLFPQSTQVQFANAEILCSEEYPITVTTPDNTEWQRKQC